MNLLINKNGERERRRWRYTFWYIIYRVIFIYPTVVLVQLVARSISICSDSSPRNSLLLLLLFQHRIEIKALFLHWPPLPKTDGPTWKQKHLLLPKKILLFLSFFLSARERRREEAWIEFCCNSHRRWKQEREKKMLSNSSRDFGLFLLFPPPSLSSQMKMMLSAASEIRKNRNRSAFAQNPIR